MQSHASTGLPAGVDAFQPHLDAASGPADRAQSLAPWRERARSAFSGKGLPHNRIEAWKYTSLRPLADRTLVPAPANATMPTKADLPPSVAGDGAIRIVLVNGVLAPDLSDLDALPEGVSVRSLGDGLPDGFGDLIDLSEHAMAALNMACLADGIAIDINAAVMSNALDVLMLASPTADAAGGGIAFHPRMHVTVRNGGAFTLVEHHASMAQGFYLSNAVTEVTVEEGCSMNHVRLQEAASDAVHVGLTAARIGGDGTYNSTVATFGAALARDQIVATLTGPQAHCRVDGAYAIAGKQHADHTSEIVHAAPDTTSRQVYKGAIDGSARGVFQGQITVHRVAQRTDGYQMNRALLLSDRSEIDSKPALEIYADDVKCSHGATAGDLDANHLFYLQSRGIPARKARAMLIKSFLAEALEHISDMPVGAAIDARLDAWTERGETS